MSEKLQKEKELVIARLELLSPEAHFSCGENNINLSRDEIINHVKNNDKIGKIFIETEMEFLRAFKTGDLANRLAA